MTELPVAAGSTVSPRLWPRLLAAGTLVWVVSVAITVLTRDTILVPTVILLGSFLIPVTVVVFALSRAGGTGVPAETMLIGFFTAGTLGVLFSALTEVYLLPTAAGTFLGVGLIEEATKGIVVAAVAWQLTTRRVRDGLVLGAVVGAGFASFESAGYALSAVIGHADDHPVLRIVGTEATRAVLAPFGHITWTALLGGALFAARAGRGRWRPVAATFAGVVLLHALWDATYGIAIIATKGLVGDGWKADWPKTADWAGSPSGHDLFVFQVVYDVLIAVNAAVGTSWLVRRWRRSRARTPV
jgi:protease PrsW